MSETYTFLPDVAVDYNNYNSNDNASDVTAGAGGDGALLAPPCDDVCDDYDYVMYFPGDMASIQTAWTEDKAFWPTAVTYGLTFLLGIVGNVMVVFSIAVDRKARNVTSLFLVSLAVADVVFLLVCVPYEVLLELDTSWAGGPALCKLFGFVEMTSTSASVLNLMAVSIERYVVIVHPMKSRSWCTIGNTKKVILLVWFVACLLSSPTLHIMDTQVSLYYNNESQVTTLSCMEYNLPGDAGHLLFAYYQLGAMFVLPVVVMVFCYSVVIHVLWSSTKELAKMTHTAQTNSNTGRLKEEQLSYSASQVRQVQQQQSERSSKFLPKVVKDHSAEIKEARKQVIRMLLAILAAFCLCWGPKLVLHAMKRHHLSILYKDSSFYANLVISLLPYIHSCLNPIIYSFMSKNFRRSMKSACRHHCCCLTSTFGGRRRRHRTTFDIDSSRSMNGFTMYSPSTSASRGVKTTYSNVSTD